MKLQLASLGGFAAVLTSVLVVGPAPRSRADTHLIDATTPDTAIVVGSVTTRTYNLVAAPGNLSTPEGNSLYFWGYGKTAAQYSGPTLVVNQGDVVNVVLQNKLPVTTSITFPGQSGVVAVGGIPGLLTRDAQAAGLDGSGGGSVSYSFTASRPGTFLYHSGTRPDLQIEMGLVGALIVRPTGFDATLPASRTAYGDASTAFDQEYLFLLSDMDESIHNTVERQVQQLQAQTPPVAVPATGISLDVDLSKRMAVYWFINGRCGPDTMMPSGHPSLPIQPYDCFPYMHPGEKVLMRLIGGGSDEHPFHHHGNHARMIAQDGRLLRSLTGTGADLGTLEFTVPSTPGSTIDTVFSWTGAGLGWDAYGHTGSEPKAVNADGVEVEEDGEHGKPFPVVLPAQQSLVDGMMYGGSPFLGTPGILPPGEGGFNPNNGFMYLWHSHAEKEIVNNDIFPGGMLTMALVEAWPAPLAFGGKASASSRRAAAPVSAVPAARGAGAPLRPAVAQTIPSAQQAAAATGIPARSMSMREAAAAKARATARRLKAGNAQSN